ncbi:MAG: hypothetical protein KUG67_02660 [Proteobacteria bacterium]|nr:hypothetical protein [Pseudomonadota bacterium]
MIIRINSRHSTRLGNALQHQPQQGQEADAENIAASEIETVITTTELINECAVVAKKHYMLDEVPVVFIIPNPNGQSLSETELKEKLIEYYAVNLADFKVVRDVHIADSLPCSTLEKYVKNELRKLFPKIESGKQPSQTV